MNSRLSKFCTMRSSRDQFSRLYHEEGKRYNAVNNYKLNSKYFETFRDTKMKIEEIVRISSCYNVKLNNKQQCSSFEVCRRLNFLLKLDFSL